MHAAAMLAGIGSLLAAWEIAGRTHALGASFAPFSQVLAFVLAPQNRGPLFDSLVRTAREAATGYGAGALAGLLLALAAALVPAASPGIERFAAIVNGIPIIAVGSLCAVTFPPAVNAPLVAALGTFFVVFVAAAAGLAAAPAIHRDIFAALGASRWMTMRRLRIPAALPSIVDGLRAGAPIAVVGAIIGEWFTSAPGLGQLLIDAMQNYQIALLWSAALLGALLAGAAYAALGGVQRCVDARFRA
jgi:ABC-type nitrate/sulfonate/bicarbonate transport system permease component